MVENQKTLKMINFEKAIALIKKNVKTVSAREFVYVRDALGRTASEMLRSKNDLPEFDCSSMDGIVVNSSDLNTKNQFRIVGESKAGMKKTKSFSSGECKYIFTGAPIPLGDKKVIPIELCKILNNNFIKVKEELLSQNFIRKKGSDIKNKQILVRKNEKLSLRNISLLFSAKFKKINVYRKPKVSIILTGDEIVKKPNLVASNNTLTIVNLLKLYGCNIEDIKYVEDDKNKLFNVYKSLNKSDLIISSGGISKGKYDLVKNFLIENKIKIIFDQVSIKPGKPTTFAKISNNRFFLGLPGNPVSCFIMSIFILKQIIDSFTKNEKELFNFQSAVSLSNFHNKTQLTLFLRIKEKSKNEKRFFKIFQTQDSHMNFMLKDATGLIILQPNQKVYKNQKYNVINFKNISYNYI